MAYADVISLKQTIHRLLNSSQFWIAYSSRHILQSAYEEAKSVQQVLEKFDDGRFRSSRRLDALDGEIRDAVRQLEDILDQSADLFLSQSQEAGFPRMFSLDMEGDQISSFADTAKKMKEDYIKELKNALLKQEDEDDVSIDFGVEMVGFSEEFCQLKKHVLKSTRPVDFAVFSITGSKGSGRTIVANTLFAKLCRNDYFVGAWVSIVPKYEPREILSSILAQTGHGEYPTSVADHDDKQQNIGEYLHGRLKGRRYMIVLDDVCDTHVWDLLKSSFPEQNDGSIVLLTTSLEEVALYANSSFIYKMARSGDEVHWHTLLSSMGYGRIITPEMEEAGRKVARNCRGHILVTIRVVCYLAGKSPEFWKKLAREEKNPIFKIADELSEIPKILEMANNLFLSWGLTWDDFDGINETAEYIKTKMFPARFFWNMETIAVLGMSGIGKTTLVKKIFGDPSILCHFDHWVWLTLGPKYQTEDIMVDILAQIFPNEDKRHIKGDPKLLRYLCGRLSSKRCLIVLDDIWTSEPLHRLHKVLPQVHGKVLLTTRRATLDRFESYDVVQQVCLLSKKESWQLFRRKVFVDGSCPPQLEKVGQIISENCEGLPLLILTVAEILSKSEKTPEYWNEVAEEQSSVFMEAYQRISKVLLPSYQNLPQYLKACLLYMGVFPQKYEVSTTKLVNYWIVEGLVEENKSQNVRDFSVECLSEIADRSLIMVLKRGSNQGIKTSALHCVFWYLCNSEAAKTKFFHAMRKCSDCVVDDRKGQRRLCIRNNVLFAIKDVHDSLASFSVARSLLCTGPRHPYPVPICFGLRLLRVLSALTIRFYEFPVEAVKLIHLRYLSLICSTMLPAFISKLRNLQFLIVDRHMCIKSSDISSYMPLEIWDMKELNHLQITGSNLPDPGKGIFLLNLLTLLDVSAASCTKKVLEGIPYLERLRILIELGPDGKGRPFHCLNNISSLARLKSLKCIVVGRQFGPGAVIPPVPAAMFPSSLIKLSLSGFGYPWDYMCIIGKLPNLKMLKLQCYAFRGPVWEVNEGEFLKLKYLSIEDADLVCWRKTNGCMSKLQRVSIKHCYKLKELPDYFYRNLEMIEVVHSNPFVDTWAERFREMGNIRYNFTLEVRSLIDAANEED